MLSCSTASLEVYAESRTAVAPISMIFLRDNFGDRVVAIPTKARQARTLTRDLALSGELEDQQW
jgi:hypothetical protein